MTRRFHSNRNPLVPPELDCMLMNVHVLVQIVIHECDHFGGEAFELYHDAEDTTPMKLSPVISIRVVRGW